MKDHTRIEPPQFARKLFAWYCRNASVEDLEGDMEELFYQNLDRMSPVKARAKYCLQILSLLFSYALRRRKREPFSSRQNYTSSHPAMIKSYFKIAYRTIGKNKVYSVINVLGLALGICACLIIYLVTLHEFSFDTFHPDKERIYRITGETKNPENEKWFVNCVPAPAPAAVREEISGFEVVTGFHILNPNVSIPDGVNPAKSFGRKNNAVIAAEPDYFRLFQYEWLTGDPQTLNQPFKVVLSESRARSFFGSLPWDKVIGKEVVYDDSLRVTVSGIVKDWDKNTDFPYTDFISFTTIRHSFLKNYIRLDDWNDTRHSSQGFVKLKPGNSPALANTLITALFKKYRKDNDGAPFLISLQPLRDIHFFRNDEAESNFLPTLYALMGLALFILIIAAINFVNLSTAQSIRRSKEIGIRKVLGSLRLSLVVQFLTETFVLTFFAVCLAGLLVKPVLSAMGSYIPAGVTFDLFSLPTLLFLLLMTVGTSILAGLYPAVILSSYLPSASLRATGYSRNGKQWLRKGLIVFQFSVSLFFIIGALVMGNQIRFIKTKNRGFNTESVITIRTNWDDKSKRPRILVENIKRLAGVANVTLQMFPPMGFAVIASNIQYQGQSLVDIPVAFKSGDDEYIPLYQIRLLAGRNIVKSDSLREFVINERYSEALGFAKPENAIDQILSYNGKTYPIVGVVENFHQRSFHESIMPCVIGSFAEFQHGIGVKLSSKLTGEETAALRTQIEKLYKQLYPDEAFESHFIEDEIAWMHDGEQKTARLMNVSMAITIFISCLGIFGLALFTAEIKTKEIGIRKVLGASVTNIVAMLSQEFVVLIVIAIAIASPVSWYFMNQWLMEFEYRVNITAWVYILAGIAAISIGLICVSFQTIRAALANPTDSLKSE